MTIQSVNKQKTRYELAKWLGARRTDKGVYKQYMTEGEHRATTQDDNAIGFNDINIRLSFVPYSYDRRNFHEPF
jgi:hypothetical protein